MTPIRQRCPSVDAARDAINHWALTTPALDLPAHVAIVEPMTGGDVLLVIVERSALADLLPSVAAEKQIGRGDLTVVTVIADDAIQVQTWRFPARLRAPTTTTSMEIN